MNNSPELLQFSSLKKYTGITHFVTTRHGGVSNGNYDSFNLSCYSDDNPQSVTHNREILCRSVDIDLNNLFIPYQTHSCNVGIIDSDFLSLDDISQKNKLHSIDALVTNQSNICIGVTTADCVPVLLFDPVKKVSAAIHAGWRGTVARIAGKTVLAMIENFGSTPSDITALIGPSIGPEAFEVGEEVVVEFSGKGFSSAIIHAEPKCRIDLWQANALDLAESGISAGNIQIAGMCTYSNPQQFFSARRLGIKSGRLVSGIIIR